MPRRHPHMREQIASADVADVIIQSFSKSGTKALVGVALGIICITACNVACEDFSFHSVEQCFFLSS